jgi:hypothetical protein
LKRVRTFFGAFWSNLGAFGSILEHFGAFELLGSFWKILEDFRGFIFLAFLSTLGFFGAYLGEKIILVKFFLEFF